MTFDEVGELRLLQAAAYAAADPWILLRAVRGTDGRIVDFTYRDINPIGASRQNRRREELIGRSVAEALPEVARSGLIAHYARCVETGEPLTLDNFSYTGHTLNGGDGIELRRYDIRGVRVDADHLSLTWRDVHQRYLAQRRIAESEERYRLLAENSWDVVAHVREGVLVWVSRSAEGPSGAQTEHWVGRRVHDLIPAEDWPVLAELLDEISSGAIARRRLRLFDAYGAPHWVEMRVRAFHDKHGNRDGETVSLRVIDAEVATERELEEARRRQAEADAIYRRSMDSAAVGMCLALVDGDFIDVNRAMCEFFGYDAETLKTKSWRELTAPEYLQADLNNVDDLMAGRIDSYRMIKQYIHADGHLIWGDLAVGCVREADGCVSALVAQVVDITDDVRAREQLDEARSELAEALEQSEGSRAVMRAISDALLDPQVLLEPQRDSFGRIVDFVYREINRATSDYLGLTPQALLGRGVVETMPGLVKEFLPGLIRCLETGEPLVLNDFRYDNEVLRDTRRYDIRGTRAGAESIVLTWRDVTERFRAAQDLAQARDLLRASTDAMLDPHAVVEAIPDATGNVVDLVLRDVNRAFCDYIGLPRSELVDRSMLAAFPDARSSGLMELYARCATTGEPVVLDDFEYFVEFAAEPRRLDIRAAQVHPGLISGTIRDSTERFEAAQRLNAELRSAATYIASIMPSGLTGEVTISSRYLPSRALGGDCFDYRWIDDEHLLVYLIDVSGHGIEPALLAVSVHNMLRSGTFPIETLSDPAAALTELNRLFKMEHQSNHFFTAWYAIYHQPTRTLRYASAGAPPAFAFHADATGPQTTELSTKSAPVGAFEDTRFTTAGYTVPPGCRILIYSDGASEVLLADGHQLPPDRFRTLVTGLAGSPDWTLDGFIEELRALALEHAFQDDVSLIRLAFD